MTYEHKTLWDYGKYAPRTPLSGHVLVGVDGSAEAARALDRAVAEAQARRTPLEILHGWPWARHGTPEPPRGADETTHSLLDRAHGVLRTAMAQVRERAPGLRATATLSPQPVAAELVRRGRNAALTVIGSRGLGEITGLTAGSVGWRVAAHCASPLLVVRGEAAYGWPEHGTVLVGVATDLDTEATRFAFEQARLRGARVRILHACAVPVPAGTAPEAGADAVVRRRAAVPGRAAAALRGKYPEIEVETDTVWGGTTQALVEATRAADAVVITAHRRHGQRPGPRLGPVTHALLHHAHCPVFLVPAP
ncbi:universal stress protein [Streptomyces sp. NPDC000987]|uniref:universal stress protein n=1 Tax=Streptomyces sp. NPDC000987 TaxID=3154374 RepID=UPI0033249DD6